MAAVNKPTGVHVSLIVFVMTTIIFGVMWYIELDKRIEVQTSEKDAKTASSESERVSRNRDDEIVAIRQLYGADLAEAGLDDPENENTVLGVMNADIKLFGKDLSKSTIRAILNELQTQIKTLTQQRNALQADLNDAKQRIAVLQNEFQSREDVFAANTEKAETDLQEQITVKDETVKTLNGRIDEVESRLRKVQIESDNEQQRLKNVIEELERSNAQMVVANKRLQDLYDGAVQLSFEVPDGEVRWVDHVSNLAWINLGETDELPKRTTFSVYTPAHNGIARGPEDIKGAIEVTRLIGPHLAEVRITSSDNLQPIAAGDPIYSPIWSSGRQHYFALLGKIDFDGDGRDDRARLHDLVTAANAVVETEVDDKGVRHGPGITVKTTFLVIGEIPDSATALASEEEAIQLMMDEHKLLDDEARKQGVRVISLNNFLNYIGYKSTRRLWVPGEPYPYKLKSGAKSIGVDETISERQSTGRTSGIYGRGKRNRAPKSNGNSVKTFGKDQE